MKPLHSLVIKDTDVFNKAVKKLKKRFRNIEKDYLSFVESIQTDEDLGIYLGDGIYKTRIANSDKHSGKSGRYRLISYLKLVDNELYLMYIYDKSDFENVSEHDIDVLILASIKG